MSSLEYAIDSTVADDQNIPQVYVDSRKNARKWKWFVDVDSIYIDHGEKDKISKKGISRIFSKAREIDSEAQTENSALNYCKKEEYWQSSKNRSQGIFRLLFRQKSGAFEMKNFVAEVIEEEFDVDDL